MKIDVAIAPEPWTADALCAQTDADLWYPELGSPARAAKMICRACPVTTECLDYALTHHEAYGIWGGLSERQRRRLRHGAPATARQLCIDCDLPVPPDSGPGRQRCDDCRRSHRRRANNESHRRRGAA